MENKKSTQKNGKQWFGVLIIIIGLIFLTRSIGIDIPYWITSWPMILIGIGLMIGVSTKFKDWTWAIITFVGLAFIIDDITGIDVNIVSILIPVSLIFLGLKLILKKKEKTIHVFDELSGKVVEEVRREDTIDLIAAFAGNKKIIVSKNFKGGSLVSVFGGNEINLSNADIQGTITLEVVQVFGGTKLIVPSNWLIKSEVTSVFGALEDKRANLNSNTEDKVLILEGTSVFASIDIRSF